MKTANIGKYFGILLAILLVFWGCMLLGGYNSNLVQVDETMLSSDILETPPLQPGDTLSQELPITRRYLSELGIHVANGSHIAMAYVVEGGGQVIAQGNVDQKVSEQHVVVLLDAIFDVAAYQTIVVRLTATEGNDATLFYGNMVQLARGMVPLADLNEATSLMLNGQPLPGKLNLETSQITPYNISLIIWLLLIISVVLLTLAYLYTVSKAKNGQSTLFVRVANAFDHYQFMLQQLVNRNFKTKYKRSLLGVLWSFLNPLLTMLIQYIVFSTLFKSNLAYFPVYLLAGTICFSFFSESTSTGLASISGNASLITKVYIPKYIFPFSTVLSSGINFALTLIPLLATVLISGLPVTQAYFFLPMVFLCLLMLCQGTTMLLATVMVFFRDIQFLWGVVTTLLMYATPLFYPETIIPEHFSFVLKLNPLYHIIRIFRVILIDCAAPEPKAVLVCVSFCLAILLCGVWVFKKQQDKFVLNL